MCSNAQHPCGRPGLPCCVCSAEELQWSSSAAAATPSPGWQLRGTILCSHLLRPLAQLLPGQAATGHRQLPKFRHSSEVIPPSLLNVSPPPAVPDCKRTPGNLFSPHTGRTGLDSARDTTGTTWQRAGEKGGGQGQGGRAGAKPICFSLADLQDISGHTYGDSTRESYRWEQRRRGRAL